MAKEIVARLWSRWPRWTAWGALVWSLGYAVAGACWTTGASWYPFGDVPDDRASASLLEGGPSWIVGPAFLMTGLLGVVAAATFLRPHPPYGLRRASFGVGVVIAVVSTCVVPDYTMLGVLAMWPVLVVFAFTGIPGDQAGIGDVLYWHRVNLILVFAGGLLWAGAALTARRRARGACTHCGRLPGAPATISEPQRRQLLRRGRGLVWLAVLATIPYDVTRLAWFAGWPLGLSRELHESLQDPPALLVVGLALGLLSTAGAALTHGLVAGWGERFPRWLPRVGGRSVPVMLAVIPASVVAVTLPPASIMFAGPKVNGGFELADWGVWLPSMFWLLWAVGLGGAAWAYYLRRRGACRHCAAADLRPSRQPSGLSA